VHRFTHRFSPFLFFLSLSFSIFISSQNPKRDGGVGGSSSSSSSIISYMAIDTPFVYQKSKKKPRKDADICEIKCKALACNIQKCMASLPTTKSLVSSSTVNFELCRKSIDRYEKCCEIWREKEKKGEV